MLRILHVLNTPRAEGTPNLVLDWLNVPGGPWQGVLVLNADPPDLTAQLRSDAAAYEEHHLLRTVGRRAKWAKFPKIARAAYQAVRRHRPDLVVCWPTGFANWVCAGAFAAGCRRLLVHAGNPPVRGTRADWVSRYSFWPMAAVRARVLCCSNYVRDEYRAIPLVPNLFSTVYNCVRVKQIVDRAAGVTRPPGGPFGIMVATLERHKDHRTLLRAVPEIVRRYPGFRVRLIGEGSLRHELEAEARAAGCEAAVDFLGARTDVPELLGGSDLFVFSTTSQEGFGTVLLEALAVGLRVVASDVPACRETLRSGEYGRLVPAGDPAALAAAVCQALVAPPGPADRNRSATYAGGFTAEKMIADYLTVAGLTDTGVVAL